MWTINTITNNYVNEISVNFVVLKSTSLQVSSIPLFGGARTVALNIPYLGAVYFQDIGNKPLGPSSQTWGVLISFNELDWVFRYEGAGQLNIVINADGTLAFNSPTGGNISPVTLANS